MKTNLSVSFLAIFFLCSPAFSQESDKKPSDKRTTDKNTSAVKASDEKKSKLQSVKADKIGKTRNVHVCGDLYFGGQFTPDDIALLAARGIQRVITLRQENEVDWDEPGQVKAAGIEFVQIPFGGPNSLTDEVFDKLREQLEKSDRTLLHCGSANRVGGAWIPYRVLDQGVPIERALREAREIGLRNAGFEKRALDYIRRKQRDISVKPGINKSFLNPELDVDSFLGRFEVESREIFSARKNVLEACGIKAGWTIADIGAGTGLYTREFSRAVGKEGWVYAVDISPRFLEHINKGARSKKLENITSVLCAQNSVSLPPNSIDLAFICDTYHHFEYPQSTMESILRALKPDGRLIVIDFNRIPGKTREWLLNHIRADKDVFRKEIEATGFKLEKEVSVDGISENYFLRFRKK